MLISLLLSTNALAFAPDADAYIGIEPWRVMHFHPERQHTLRRGDAWQQFLETDGAGWDVRFDERTDTVYRAWGPGIDMGKVQFATAALEAAAMATSLMLDEFTAQNLWMVQASVVLAVVVAAGLYPTTQAATYETA